MSRVVVLRMSDEDAETFLEDAREYPGRPLLTPVQEHDVRFEVDGDYPAGDYAMAERYGDD